MHGEHEAAEKHQESPQSTVGRTVAGLRGLLPLSQFWTCDLGTKLLGVTYGGSHAHPSFVHPPMSRLQARRRSQVQVLPTRKGSSSVGRAFALKKLNRHDSSGGRFPFPLLHVSRSLVDVLLARGRSEAGTCGLGFPVLRCGWFFLTSGAYRFRQGTRREVGVVSVGPA